MGRKGVSTGLKRKPAPRFWPIHRKENTWIVRPSAGAHSRENSIPLAIVIRDILGFAQTRKEAKTIVSQGKVHVDGKITRKDDFSVGLMDAVFVPELDKCFRVLPSRKGLILHQTSKEEARFKLCRIEDKKVIRKGHVQISLHDGSNILVKVADAKNPREDVFRTFDTLMFSLPDRQILDHVKMKENDLAIITGGKNIGKLGKIVEIEKTTGKRRREALIVIEDEKGTRYQTIQNFVFAVGETKPLVALPEATLVV